MAIPAAVWWGLGVAAAGALVYVFVPTQRVAPPAWQSANPTPLLGGLLVSNPLSGTDPAPSRKWVTDTRGQKYADPFVNLRSDTTYGIAPGREYLRAVPAVGSARVSAMLAKVNGYEGTRAVEGIDALRALGGSLMEKSAADQEKARQDVNSLINTTAAKLGPYAIAVAKAWGVLSDAFAPLLGKTGSAAKYVALVEGASNEILRASEADQRAALPFVWHLFQYLPTEAMTSEDTLGRMQFLARTAQSNNGRLARLPAHRRAAIQALWLLLLERLAADKFVERVFRAMHGGEWGGMGNYASDEQVMLVGAVVASKMNLDPQTFTAALWDRNGGWSDPKYRGLLANAEYLAPSDAGSGSGGPPDWPTNATQVQWAGLMETALDLAKTFPRKPAPSAGPIATKGLGRPPWAVRR